jgi:hypothetical protein
MTASASRIWTPRSGPGHRSPFRTGVDRALADAFPLADDTDLPHRIATALVRLEDALREGAGDPPPTRLERS